MVCESDHRVGASSPTGIVRRRGKTLRRGPRARWAGLPASRKLIGGGSFLAVLGLIGFACPGGVGHPLAGRHLQTVRINSERPHAGPAPHGRTPAGPALGNVLLEMNGTGHRQSAVFSAHGPWDLAYAYDCSNFPDRTGDFFVAVRNPDGSVSPENLRVDESGHGRGAAAHGRRAGAYYVSVDTECNWAVKARAR